MGLMFFPRGGSAQVTRYLAGALPPNGWDATVLAGSLGGPGDDPHAGTFFEGLDVVPVPYDDALEADDPLRADPPMHPSFEDRPGAPDRVFANVDDDTYEHLVDAWIGHLERAGAADADLLHLHHLTPLNEAAARAFPDKPVVGHLHGTELLMLREIELGAPPGWAHTEAWVERMRGWADRCQRLFVLSPEARKRAPGSARDRSREGRSRLPTGSTPPPSTAGRSRARSASSCGASGWWTTRAGGRPAASPGAFATTRLTSTRSAASARCFSTSAATPR